MCSWIKYAIGKLSPAQQKYSAYDLELLAIYVAVRNVVQDYEGNFFL